MGNTCLCFKSKRLKRKDSQDAFNQNPTFSEISKRIASDFDAPSLLSNTVRRLVGVLKLFD